MSREARRGRGASRGLGPLRTMLGVVLVVKMGLVASWLIDRDAALALGQAEAPSPAARAASHPALAPVPVSIHPVPVPGDHREARALLQALAERQAELEKRERALAAREERVSVYEKDLTDKIARLEELQKQIVRESNQVTEADSEAAASLAKVYAAMKPADAAPLLDRLDDKTVLRILSHMRAKQIGELLPLLDRDKAIVLTQALASGN